MRSASRPSVRFWIFAAVVRRRRRGSRAGPLPHRRAWSGFLAQRLCGTYLSLKRDPDAVLAEDLSGAGYELLWFFQPSVDARGGGLSQPRPSVSAGKSPFSEKALAARTLSVSSEEELRDETANLFATTQPPDLHALLAGRGNASILRRFRKVWTAPRSKRRWTRFAEPDPAHPRHTCALAAVHQSRIVAERYAPGFDAGMPPLGWSLRAAALNVLVGERALGGLASLPLATGRCCRMWQEARSRATSHAVGRLAASLPQSLFIHPPGTVWHHCGGTSLILPPASCQQSVLRASGTICALPRERLVRPARHAGARSIEADDPGKPSSPRPLMARASARAIAARPCSRRMACGKAGACCPKVGSPTPDAGERRP